MAYTEMNCCPPLMSNQDIIKRAASHGVQTCDTLFAIVSLRKTPQVKTQLRAGVRYRCWTT